MATIQLTINGERKNVKENTLNVYAAISTTDNPGADTLKRAVELAGGNAWLASVEMAGLPDDSIVVVKEITRKGVKGIVTGKLNRSQFINRCRLALDYQNWATSIETLMEDGGESSKKADDDSPVEAV